jgi:hypothetical protein
MGNEPILTYKLSQPLKFQCSACRDIGSEGAFTLYGSTGDMVEAFRQHVKDYHSKGEDFSQPAAKKG